MKVLKFISAEPQLIKMWKDRVPVHIDPEHSGESVGLKIHRYRPVFLEVGMPMCFLHPPVLRLNAQAIFHGSFKLRETGLSVTIELPFWVEGAGPGARLRAAGGLQQRSRAPVHKREFHRRAGSTKHR